MRFLGQCVRRLAVLCAAAGLSACASGIPLGVLDPVALPPGATTETMFVATTRARPKVELARMFSGERSRTVDHARITVSIPPNHESGQIEWPRSAPGDPRTSFVTADRDYMLDKAFIASIRTELAKRKPADQNVLIFIHGYNTKFEEAVFRFAQIIHDFGLQGRAGAVHLAVQRGAARLSL